MRRLVIIGGGVLGLLAAAYVLTSRQVPPEEGVLEPLEVSLARSLVLYMDGTVPPDVYSALQALDAQAQALAPDAAPRTLMDLDVYVMLRPDWDVFRAIDGHDLTEVIREKAENKSDGDGVAWFKASLASSDGSAPRNLLVILATDAALTNLGAFCFTLTVYDIARFAHHGALFSQANVGPGTQWKQCRAKGWYSTADIPAQG